MTGLPKPDPTDRCIQLACYLSGQGDNGQRETHTCHLVWAM